VENRQVLVVRAEDAAAYAEKTDFAGKTLVAEAGSAGEDAIASDLADAKYTAVTSQANALLEIKAKTADAAVIDYTMARALTRAGSDYADLVLLDIRLSEDGNEEYAIGFRLGSTAVARVNEIIGALAADGTLTAIAERYGVKDLLLK
jgi:polar amino acid transport system substrate-binding protein